MERNVSAQVAVAEAPITGLVPANPVVTAVAEKLRWKPSTLIARVKEALPAVVEQQMYLTVCEDFRIHPETMATLLEAFRGFARPLEAIDAVSRPVGRDLIVNRLDIVSEKVEWALAILDKDRDHLTEIQMSAKHVAVLVNCYGEHSEVIVDTLISEASMIAESIGWDNISENAMCGVLFTMLVEFIEAAESPNPITGEEIADRVVDFMIRKLSSPNKDEDEEKEEGDEE